MPAATHTEVTFADIITVTCSRFRTAGNAIDWTFSVNANVLDAQGNVVFQALNIDLATLISGANITSIKGFLNTAVTNSAANRSITTNA